MNTEQQSPLESSLSPWRAFEVESPKADQNIATDAKPFNPVLEWTVYHTPMGAPRMTQRDKWAKRDCVIRYRAFKDAIRRDSPTLPKPDMIASLSWIAYLPIPASWSVRKRKLAGDTIHRAKPDRDNIDKAILDALFEDDAGISCGWIEKRWSHNPRLLIRVLLLPPIQSSDIVSTPRPMIARKRTTCSNSKTNSYQRN